MQFVEGGPDIPDEVLRAQEAGLLVFYCGAGISAGADLPGYGKLVDEIYEAIGVDQEPAEIEAIGPPKDPKALYD